MTPKCCCWCGALAENAADIDGWLAEPGEDFEPLYFVCIDCKLPDPEPPSFIEVMDYILSSYGVPGYIFRGDL